MNIKLFKIKEIENQHIIHGIFHCKYKELKKTKYGDCYIAIGLIDSSGNIEGKLWKNSQYYDSQFNEGDIVAIKGAPNLYRKKIELNISHISKYQSSIYDTYGFNSESMISKINYDNAFLWKEVYQYFKQTGDNCKIIKSLYKDYKKNIIQIPYNINSEHQLEGSYLNNLYRALKIFELLFNNSHKKESIDSDLVYSLIFLKNFDMVTGYKKNIIYTLNQEAADRGSMNVFHDCFKKYRALTSKKLFSLLEKCIFEPTDIALEEKIAGEIFRLVENVD